MSPRSSWHVERSQALYDELGLLEGQSSTLGDLGLCYLNQGDVLKAIECHERSLTNNKKLGRVQGEASQHGNLGICYAAQGDVQLALSHFDLALALHRRMGLSDDHPSVSSALAFVAFLRPAASS